MEAVKEMKFGSKVV